MKPSVSQSTALLLLASAAAVYSAGSAHDDHDDSMNMGMDMGMATAIPSENQPSLSSDSPDFTPTPWAMGHMHGVPILDTKLTPQQEAYWKNYNTTTYLTLDTPYHSYLMAHIAILLVSAFVLYPFVLIFNNLESNWFLPLLWLQASLSIISCILYSVFINNVADLYPNMSYSKMITGLFVLTILQVCFSTVFSIKRWLYPTNPSPSSPLSKGFQPLYNYSDDLGLNIHMDANHKLQSDAIQLNNLSSSPASTLCDVAETDGHFNLENNNSNNINSNISNSHSDLQSFDGDDNFETPIIPDKYKFKNSDNLTSTRNKFLEKLSSSKILVTLVSTCGTSFTILHNVTIWAVFTYYFALFPTGIACLNLFGQGMRVFNLLAHFIKGGVFFILGLISLARYCGAFSGIGGSWNYAYVDLSNNSYLQNRNSDPKHQNTGVRGVGSGGSNVTNSLWVKIHNVFTSIEKIKNCGGTLCSFEFIESLLIFIYGSSNVFLEHLGSTDGVWTAKDLQHVSIAFMYFGAGLCGLITELKLSSWKRSQFFTIAGEKVKEGENIQLDDNLPLDEQRHLISANKLVTPGFSPNPFPVFTIFWTGVLMSKHAQATALSTEIHVQWGTLLAYGSFFRVFTFLLLTYYPFKNSNDCFKPFKPLTELITSFCLLCGGMVFMESTDQVIEALAYRGLTPMFTINVSVSVVSLIMAWVMLLFAIKDRLRS